MTTAAQPKTTAANEPNNNVGLRPPFKSLFGGMDKLKIIGGKRLNGTIKISGAKNASLPLMCACLLTSEPVELTNLPSGLNDIRTLGNLLADMGMAVELFDGRGIFAATNITNTTASYDLVRKMRASILVLGPLLARFGTATVSLPGGCAIGTRPVDMHIEAMEALGATIEVKQGYVQASAPNGLKGARISFQKVSVGATENAMMAATLASGKTVIENAAREPEIVNLGECLNAMGAKITGLGTDTITVQGVKSLHGTSFGVIADRIETGTYMVAVAMAGGEVFLQNGTIDHLGPLVSVMRKAGVEIDVQENGTIRVYRNGLKIKGVDIMTEPYPGFPTDLQAQVMTMLTICDGAGMVTETIFENRFMHVPELCRMGADITIHGSSALVRGVPQLNGAEVMATDLRASVSLILAALAAEGETTINRIYHLDRGYENIVDKLGKCGAQISRVTDNH